jgi:hypothetical protein
MAHSESRGSGVCEQVERQDKVGTAEEMGPEFRGAYGAERHIPIIISCCQLLRNAHGFKCYYETHSIRIFYTAANASSSIIPL